MTKTITLAQLSDVHLSPLRGLAWRHLNLKRGLGYLNWQRSRKHVHRRDSLDLVVADMVQQRPDHIAVTGDLINLGLPAEYEAAAEWLGALGSPDRVTAIPGNHDVYTTLRDDVGIGRWAPYMRSDAAGAAFTAGVTSTFPFVRVVGPVALVCLNSAVETPPFVAAGELGARQIADLAAILDRTGKAGLVRVVLIHHPPLSGQAPPRRALRDAAALEHVLSEHGAELVLHGHNHRDNHLEFSWARGHVTVIGIASGSGGRLHKGEPLARYHLLRITRTNAGAQIECTSRGLDATGRSVVQLDRKLIA